MANTNLSRKDKKAAQSKKSTRRKRRVGRDVESVIDRERMRDQSRAEQEANKYYAPGSLPRVGYQAPVRNVTAPPQAKVTARVSTEMEGGAASIAKAEQAYEQAKIRDQYVKEALDRMQSGLGGYTAPENQSLRESATREIRGARNTSLRSLRGFQAENGVTGSSATAQAGRVLSETDKLLADKEVDLVGRNLEEQRSRLGQFANTALASDESMRAGVGNALDRLLGAQKTVADYRQQGEQANVGAEQSNVDNNYKYDYLNYLIDTQNSNDRQQVDQYNASQQEKELAGRLGIVYGDQAVTDARRAREQNRREAIRLRKDAARGY